MSARASIRTGDLNRLLKAAKERGGLAVVIEGGQARLEPYEPPPPPPPPPLAGPCVYFVRVRGFDLVKIGFSTNVTQRIRDLENGAGMGGAMVELLRLPGDMRFERSLHRQFADQRLFGEWFTLSGPVADWLAEQAREAA